MTGLFCLSKGLDRECTIFFHDGHLINQELSAEACGIRNNDVITYQTVSPILLSVSDVKV